MSASERLKAFVLQAEHEDAAKRLNNRAYWGDTGEWVVLAIMAIEGVIDRVCAATQAPTPALWLAEVIAATEVAHQHYRQEEEDPDGYGSATFNGALGRMQQLLEALQAEAAEAESRK